jgi:AbrB family looped-hinge helix DNA binding protein
MQYATTLTQKGQATIPVSLRRKLGLKKGHKIVFEERKNEVVLKKRISLDDLQGSLKSSVKFDDRKADKAVGEFLASEYAKKWQK